MSPLIRLTRATFRSLRVRNYRLYFFGQVASMTGTWTQITAQMWLVLQLSGSGVALGIVSALQFLPVMLAGAWGGVVADRVDKRKLLLATQSSGAVIAAALGVLVLGGWVELWMVYGLAVLMGFTLVVDVPTRQAFVSEMVGPDEVANAIGLNSTVFTTARVIGPAVAAGLIATVGIGWAFVVNGLSYSGVLVALAMMDGRSLRRTQRRDERARGQLLDGFRYAWNKPVLRSSLLLMAIVGTLAFNFRVVLPLLAQDAFAGDAGTYGLLSSVMGAGTLVGALASAAWARPTRALLAGSAIAFGSLIVLASLAPTVLLEAIVLFPLGAASIAFVSTCNAMLQIHSEEHMRGRVMALYSVLFLGSTPIGGPLVGLLAESAGVRFAFGLAGVATTLGGLAAFRALRKARVEAALRPGPEPPLAAPAATNESSAA